MYKFSSLLVIALLAFHLGGAEVRAQVSIQANTTITEDFNSLGTSATATLPSGWRTDIDNIYVQKVNNYAGAITSTSYRAGNNFSANAYGIYNYGAGEEGTATDRSLGWYADNFTAKSGNLYVHLRNTGVTQINGLTISFDVEKYRKGTNSAGYSIYLYYSANGSDWTNSGSVFRVQFDPDNDNNGYPSAPGNTKNIVQMSLPVSIPQNTDIYLAWNYTVTSTTATSNSQGLGIDNVTIYSEPFPLNSSYSWVNGSTDFSAPASWNPQRNSPKSTDILVFGTGGTQNVTLPSLTSFGRLQIQNNTTVNLSSASTSTLIATGNSGAVNITSGSKLNLNGSNPVSIQISSNTISTINGEISFSGGAHRILPQDESTSTKINFEAGSKFTADAGFTGYPFGTKYSSTVEFKSGSELISKSGESPFGIDGSDAVVTFSRGSTFKIMQNKEISRSDRVYSNIVIDYSSYDQYLYGGAVTLDSIIINNATSVYFDQVTLSIKGNINAKSGTLTFEYCIVNFIGRDPQFISANSNPITFTGNTLDINNESTSNPEIVLNTNLTIGGSLTISKGNIRTGNYTLEVSGIISNMNGSNVNGYIIGNLKKPVSSGGTRIVTFPIGTDNGYSPLTVTFNSTSTAGNLTATAIQSPHPNAVIPEECLQRYWSITNNGITFSTASVKMNYLAADFTTSFPEATYETSMQVGKYDGAWSFPSISNRTPGGTNDGGSITISGITGFSTFTTTRNESALPVELNSFTHNIFEKRNVKLLWETSSEQNNSGFDIERTLANKNEWVKIGFKEGKGTTNNTSSYTFEDRNLPSGNYKYRLKQIDYNGNYTYFELSDEVIVSTPAKFDISQNYPNPFNPVSKVNFDLPEDAFVSIQIYDMTGRNVKTVYNQFTTAGYHTTVIDASSLTSGVYFYKFNAAGFSKVMKMVVIK